MKRLISFDIDGTLETGIEPGPLTIAMVRRAQELGYIIGSCSDRPVSAQRAMWERQGVVVDFTVLKHMLEEVRTQFEADEYFHIGDTDLDRHYAVLAGFEFLPVATTTGEPWMLNGAEGLSS
ncbi:MAG: hypothetical protein ABID84_01950 [Chloroflexota bacterium]